MWIDAGSAGGLSLASASIVCTGPGVPVPMTGSTALAAYANTFQGVSFAQDTDPDGGYIAIFLQSCYCNAEAVLVLIESGARVSPTVWVSPSPAAACCLVWDAAIG